MLFFSRVIDCFAVQLNMQLNNVLNHKDTRKHEFLLCPPPLYEGASEQKCPVRYIHYTLFPDDYRRTIRGMAFKLYALMKVCRACMGLLMVDLGLFVKVREMQCHIL